METRLRSLLIASVLAVAWTGICRAEPPAYPSRPVTMIVPLPPGSAFDVTARLLAERLQEQLGQRVIVDNQTGASGSIGTGRCAHAAPDGYTLCFGGVGTHVLNAAILALPYDWADHYSQLANYLRLNAISPPNAKARAVPVQ